MECNARELSLTGTFGALLMEAYDGGGNLVTQTADCDLAAGSTVSISSASPIDVVRVHACSTEVTSVEVR